MRNVSNRAVGREDSDIENTSIQRIGHARCTPVAVFPLDVQTRLLEYAHPNPILPRRVEQDGDTPDSHLQHRVGILAHERTIGLSSWQFQANGQEPESSYTIYRQKPPGRRKPRQNMDEGREAQSVSTLRRGIC